MLLGGFVLKHIRKYFPPVVTGIVVLTMGISLLPTGVNYFAGGVEQVILHHHQIYY